MNEKTRAKGNVDFLYIGSVWIGLTKVGYIHWGWSMGENTLSDYNNWNKEQPDNSFLEGHCGAISQINGYWSSVSCLEILNFACYDESDGMFYQPVVTLSWSEAQTYCRNFRTDLASIRNPSEQSRVFKFVDTTDYMWIGLFGDTWSWSDQSSTTFRYWGSGRPLDLNLNYSNCVAMDMSEFGLWTNYNCNNKLPFMCYKVAESTKRQVVEFKVTSDGDLNMMKENILKMIGDNLRAQGNNYSNLSWRESNGQVFTAEKNETAVKLPESCEVTPLVIDNSTQT
ncbi:lymphocyte antigen 75 [Astyanax mexicanus]|uniref:lymphocyte antigen 75 n=1 Tax=Astyanax mexicanus TaxID=7994 RepID=UPI0020CB4F4C|nr:lymphocyte antigen 75 [Astyanax mexicanus]